MPDDVSVRHEGPKEEGMAGVKPPMMCPDKRTVVDSAINCKGKILTVVLALFLGISFDYLFYGKPIGIPHHI